VPEVLFVCVGNASHSAMAAVLTRHQAGTRLHIRTGGGSNPREAIYPEVVQAMASLSLEMPNSGYGDIADHNQLVSGLLATFMAGSLLGRWHLMSLVRHRAVGFFRSASSVANRSSSWSGK
jgi:hypothetical protein